VGEQLHLDLVDLPGLVGGLDVDDAEFIVAELAFVVGVGDEDVADRSAEGIAEDGV